MDRQFSGMRLVSLAQTSFIFSSGAVPRSFHPVDLRYGAKNEYPIAEGEFIDDDYFVDGGIAAPALYPPFSGSQDTIIVSPISGRRNTPNRVSPKPDPFRPVLTLKGGFEAQASLNNLQSLIMSVGASKSEDLESWYYRAMEDATSFIVQADALNLE